MAGSGEACVAEFGGGGVAGGQGGMHGRGHVW